MRMKRPALRYHGGKWMLAKWILSHFPPHKIYLDIFGGGGSILLQKPRSYAEVYNDKWDIVVNVFTVLRDPEKAAELERVLRLTPFARTEFEQCGNEEISKITDPIEKARRTIFRSFAGFGSASTNAKHATGFRANANRSGTTPAHDWMNYPKYIQTFTERLRGVIIENKDYADVITQHDGPETLIYADPPYVHDTRNLKRGNALYKFEMSDSDHEKLSVNLRAAEATVILSGYDCEMYQDIYKDWSMIRREAFADGAAKRAECLWINRKNLNLFN